jgi:hypothetical protein
MPIVIIAWTSWISTQNGRPGFESRQGIRFIGKNSSDVVYY